MRSTGGGLGLLGVLIVTNLVFAAGLIYALFKIARYRQLKKMRGPFGAWPIPQVEPGEFDPRLAHGEFGPGHGAEIRFVSNWRVPGGTSDLETWILCNLAKSARRIFEIGTATGKTTYLMAANAPADAKVITITLPPEARGAYHQGAGDDPEARKAALEESAYKDRFYYSGTPEAAKIVQLLGDSKELDETPYLDSCDFVFVDGSHAYSFVESDTKKAMRMVKPGGAVLWHDYRGPRPPRDVFRYLNELSRTLPGMVHIRGTALVAWRRPA